MKIVCLFSGQGAQKVGMGRDLAAEFPAANALLDKADTLLDYSLREVMFEGPEDSLVKTSCCQPALFVHGMMLVELLREKLEQHEIIGTAGLSLGEFTAHAFAGTFSFEEGVEIVFKRGRYMEEACEQTQGAMAAMIGGEIGAVKELAKKHDVDIANFNAPGQIVLSGKKEAIENAILDAKKHGIKLAKKLPVAGAYHSRLMDSAQKKLAQDLQKLPIQHPNIPTWSNVTAQQTSDPNAIRENLLEQVTGSVRWTESIQQLAEQRPLFLELGPGRVLAGLMKRIDKTLPVISIEDITSLEEAKKEL